MDLHALLTLSLGKKQFANPRRIQLLQQIAATGSISQGAKLAKMSYKAAWDAVNDMNNALEQPVVSSEKGGKGGGGAKLTAFGERLLKVYSITTQVQDMALTALLDDSVSMNSLLELMAHFSLHTSARNQLTGKVFIIDEQGINDMITLVLNGGQHIKVMITHTSTQRLGLMRDLPVLLLFKAPVVTICEHYTAQSELSQNILRGHLSDYNEQDDELELTLSIGAKDNIYSVMQKRDLDTQRLQIGQEYYACFDFSQIIIANMQHIS